MNTLKLAVISDLHCHHSSSGPAESLLVTDIDRSPSSQHPVEAILELIKKDAIAADILLMPGDLTNRVDRQGLVSGWGYVGEIADALGVNAIAPTLGNHDVCSRKPEDDPFKIVRGLSPRFPVADDQICNEFWGNGFCVLNGVNFRILIVNSVMSHINEESAKRGMVSPQQLDAIARALAAAPDKTFQIAVCHHHPIPHEDIGLGAADLMVNGSLLTELLSEKGFHLLVHGHKHHPKLSYTNGILPVLASGSFAAGMKNGLASRTRNVFHYIHMEYDSNQNQMNGTVLTWQFRQSKGWTPASWDAVDFPHKTGFGCLHGPDHLADRVRKTFTSIKQPIEQWQNILTSIPDLKYITPDAFQKVGAILKEHRIDLQPSPPDEPKYIGTL